MVRGRGVNKVCLLELPCEYFAWFGGGGVNKVCLLESGLGNSAFFFFYVLAYLRHPSLAPPPLDEHNP